MAVFNVKYAAQVFFIRVFQDLRELRNIMPRNKKTIKALKRNGTYRPSRHGQVNAEVPDSLLGEPPMPSIIKGEARSEWKRIINLLSERGDLSPLYMAPIASYCLMWQRIYDSHISEAEPISAAFYSEYRQHCAMLGITPTASPNVVGISKKLSNSLSVLDGKL